MNRIDETTNNELVFYSIKDLTLDFFAFPFTARSDRDAMAMVRSACDSGSTLHRFPDHYALYKVGVFDDRTGEFKSFVPVQICPISVLTECIEEVEEDADCS